MKPKIFGRSDATTDDEPLPRDLDEPGDNIGSVQPAAGVRARWDRLVHRADRAGVREFAAPASTRLFLLLFATAMLCGPAALIVLSTTRPVPPTQVAQAAAAPSDRDQVRAGAAAVELVRVWLSAGTDDTSTVVSVMGRDPGPFTLPAQRSIPPAWISVDDTEETGPGEWTVTVAVGAAAGPAASHYTVLVAVTTQQAAAITLPARIPNPRRVHDTRELRLLSTGDPITVTTTGFLTSLLTGANDLSRWLTPDSALQPTGSICQTVKIRRVETASNADAPASHVADVLATTDCQPGSDKSQVQTLQYPLTLQLRDGRWEVVGYAPTLPTTEPTDPATESADTSSNPGSPHDTPTAKTGNPPTSDSGSR